MGLVRRIIRLRQSSYFLYLLTYRLDFLLYFRLCYMKDSIRFRLVFVIVINNK